MKERAVERYAGSGVHTGVFLLLWRTVPPVSFVGGGFRSNARMSVLTREKQLPYSSFCERRFSI